jgi:hypothetical protein
VLQPSCPGPTLRNDAARVEHGTLLISRTQLKQVSSRVAICGMPNTSGGGRLLLQPLVHSALHRSEFALAVDSYPALAGLLAIPTNRQYLSPLISAALQAVRGLPQSQKAHASVILTGRCSKKRMLMHL